MSEKRYIVIDSTKFIGKYSVYDTYGKVETPCHNYATARNLCDEWNKNDNHCSICKCDPCDCHGSEDLDDSYWKIIGDK